ncbi:histidine phosphatase family protein [Bombilactobacillus bombi]|uniref:histidine phosphatase family protein n=1 Tax=Bombilactobacillus bombi TaxID=1303590 RepID=UPI0015E61C4B|nr:histidine phosphatase family protein [Bombilactobacillus bombi]MBA1434794.1 histidine phosphatase family protein [Bombilactobacillus bombi]
MTVIQLYFMRHGQTLMNQKGLVQGVGEGWLNNIGVQQAQSAAWNLRQQQLHFDLAFSSPRQRARQTAQIVLAATQPDLKLQTLPSLGEVNFGHYEGQRERQMFAEVIQHRHLNAQTLTQYIQKVGTAAFLQELVDAIWQLDLQTAENYQQVVRRMQAALKKIINQAQEQAGTKVLVVSHGLSLMILLATLTPHIQLPITGLDNVSCSQVNFVDGIWQIETINQQLGEEKQV